MKNPNVIARKAVPKAIWPKLGNSNYQALIGVVTALPQFHKTTVNSVIKFN